MLFNKQNILNNKGNNEHIKHIVHGRFYDFSKIPANQKCIFLMFMAS